jgi:hypothetical protein
MDSNANDQKTAHRKAQELENATAKTYPKNQME